jgi:hypothetical protein
MLHRATLQLGHQGWRRQGRASNPLQRQHICWICVAKTAGVEEGPDLRDGEDRRRDQGTAKRKSEGSEQRWRRDWS